jgi:putative nucleotidyltransferase with HDIG domain
MDIFISFARNRKKCKEQGLNIFMYLKEKALGIFRHKLSIFTTIFGWVVLFVYVLYDYKEYGSNSYSLFGHFFRNESFIETLFHILVLSTPVGSTITGYLISSRKILLDKTQKSERQLRNSSSEWKITFDSMPYGIFLTDGQFNIIRANTYISNHAGSPIKELIFNKKCYEAVLKRETPCYGCPLDKVNKTMCKVTTEHQEADIDYYFTENVAPIQDHDGSVISYVHSVIDIRETKEKERQLIQAKDAFFNMLKDLDSTYDELKDIYNSLVVAFSNVIDAKSAWTKGHSINVARHAVAIARKLGLGEDDIFILRTAALLHDIGKIGTYDKVLDKKSKLTDNEFSLIRMHPIQGEKILRPIKGLENMLPVIRHHHERLDGSGYPDQLKGDEISFLAKILCVADAYDSMITNRPYRSSLSKQDAIEELKRCSGTQFDSQVVEAFVELV